MTQYRKKPVVIEAFKYLTDKVPSWWVELEGIRLATTTGAAYIPTLEGEMRAEPGDDIIQGVKGEVYPCKPDIFEATYQLADLPGGDEFTLAVRPAIEFMNTLHPHHTLIVTATDAELLEGARAYTTHEFLKD